MGFWKTVWEYTKVLSVVAIGAALSPSLEDQAVTEAIEKEKAERERRKRERAEKLAKMTPTEKEIFLLKERVDDLESDNASLRSKLSDMEDELEEQKKDG